MLLRTHRSKITVLRQVVCPYVRATPSLQGTQLYLLAKVIIFHQFSTFLCLLFEGQHMQFAPKQAVLTLNEAQKKKVENMGRFITTMYINDLTFVNFSDAQAQNVPNINILFPYGAYLQNEQMRQLEAYVAKKYLYMQNPSELYRK